MANYSEHTRKEQVFNYLRTRINSWVDGTELANEEVGGSEGLKRLRELRKDLREDSSRFEIEMRGHPDPDRDIYQYRLIEKPAQPAQPAREAPRPPDPTFKSARGHVVFDKDTDTYVAVYDGPPIVIDEEAQVPVVPGQQDMNVPTDDGLKFTTMPTRVDFGKTRPCPKCHGIHRAINEKGPDGKALKVPGPTGKLINKTIGYESFTRNPSKPSEDCPRCNGFGLIPA